jgi:hypothetical protein
MCKAGPQAFIFPRDSVFAVECTVALSQFHRRAFAFTVMKKTIAISIVAVVFMVGALSIGSLAGNSRRDVALGFVGLTNTGVRTGALFVLSNHPGNIWLGVTALSRKTADGWVAETNRFFNLSFHGSLLGVPINTTKVPSRSVILIRLPSMMDRAKQIMEKTFHLRRTSTFGGHSYYITNEIPTGHD